MSMPQPVKIVIAEDHQLFADGLETMLNGDAANYEVIAKVNNGKQLMQVMNKALPDLLLMDINMPYMNGMEAAIEIKKRHGDIKIIFISMYSSPGLIAESQKNGIAGFVTKDISVALLKKTIAQVMAGQKVYLGPTPIPQFLQQPGDDYAQKLKLSPRQLEIIVLIKNGLATNKDIANNLCLSVFTVETHLKNIFQILNVKNKIELLKFAAENNIA